MKGTIVKSLLNSGLFSGYTLQGSSKSAYFWKFFSLIVIFILFYFCYQVRAFLVSVFSLVQLEQLDPFILVCVFNFLIFLILFWNVLSFLIAVFFDNNLALKFTKKCIENKVVLSCLGGFFLIIFLLSALVELKNFHILILILVAWALFISDKRLSEIFFSLGVALINPKALIFFFAVLQFNFITFLLFNNFWTFSIICYPLAYFLDIPDETWVKFSVESENLKVENVFWMKPVDFNIVNAKPTQQLAQKLANVYFSDLVKSGSGSKNAFTKNVDIVYQGKVDVNSPTILQNLGFENKKLVQLYREDPLKARLELEKNYPQILSKCTPAEVAYFYENMIEVCLAIEKVEQKSFEAFHKECIRGLLSEASQNAPDRLAEGLLGKEVALQVLKSLSVKELGANPLATFLISDVNHIVQSQNSAAVFSNDFSAMRLATGVNELATAVAYGEKQGGVVEISRSVLGDVSVQTKENCAVLSVKENGEGRLDESLQQVIKAIQNPKLAELHKKESLAKGIKEYYVATAGKKFTEVEYAAHLNKIEMLNKHFNKEWKQKFYAKNLGKK